MKDRISQNPGRVLITPENGAAPFYAMMSRADNPTQKGDPIDKNTLLKDSTAAMFGLDASALPDHVLQILAPNSLVNMHVWSKYSTATEYYMIQSYAPLVNKQYFNATSHDYTKYYTEASIVDGQIVLSGSHPADYTEMVGCYYLYTSDDTSEYRKVKGVSIDDSGTSSDLFTYYVVTVGERAAGDLVGYVASVDQGAYPPSESDGYDYRYMGLLGYAGLVEAGSYTGTGTYGSDNKNRLNLGFEPKVVFINGPSGYGGFAWIYGKNSGLSYVSMTQKTVSIAWDNTGLSWYSSDSSEYQLNKSGTTYNYVAIG